MFGGFIQPYLTIVFVYVDIVDNIHYMFIWVLSANINHGGWRHRHTPLTGVFDNTITLCRLKHYCCRTNGHRFDYIYTVLTIQELSTVMKSLGLQASQEELQEMMTEADEDGSGSIEFEEFLSMMKRKMKENESSMDDVKAAFKVFDQDGDG